MSPQQVDLTPLAQALATLDEALGELAAVAVGAPLHSLLRDAVVKRFEYSFELAWKFMRRVLLARGREDPGGSPRPILRRAGQDGLIDDVEAWFAFLAARNATTHQYDVRVADATALAARDFARAASGLSARLQACLDAA